jgi:hypothetical protein
MQVCARMLALRSQLPADQVPQYGPSERLGVVDLHLLARAVAELVRRFDFI